MPFQLFQYRLPADSDIQDLNRFLGTHRIVTIHREIVPTSSGPLLVFVVEYSSNTEPAKSKEDTLATSRVDFRQLLTPEQFDQFNRLRTVRKEIAESESVPVYTILTNAQLAALVQNNCNSLSAMQEVEGIGKARIEKYGDRFLAVLLDAIVPPASEVRHESRDESVPSDI